jgi:tetratricopeptide (TPR) repeat protein
LLLGSLYYVAGKNNEALAVFKTVEPELQRGEQHRWLLVAMLTAELRVGRLNEAKALMNQLQVAYPGAAELDEARFRLGVFHFDRGELDRARVCFEDLLAASRSPTYRRMCTEYLDRIAHLEDIRRHEEATK